MEPDTTKGYEPPSLLDKDDGDDDSDNDIEIAKFEDENPPKPMESIFSIYGKNVILAMITHSLWSSLPVFTRYLLVKAPSNMNSLVLLSSTKLTAFVCIYLFGDYSFIFKLADEVEGDKKKASETTGSEAPNQELEKDEKPPVTIRSKIITGATFALLTTFRAGLGVECLRYTTAKNTSLIQALSPLIVPLADAVFLNTELPRALWPTVTLSSLGCAIVIFSQHSYNHTFTRSDAIGCTLKFASVCITALTRLIMKTSSNVLSRNELLQFANVGTFVLPLIFTLCLDPSVWLYFLDIQKLPFAVAFSWAAIGILVYFLGAAMQVELIRALSPGLYSSFEAIRVLGAIFLSSLWLHEAVQNWVEWLGIVLTVGVITRYLKVLLTEGNKPKPEQSEKEQVKKADMEEYGCYIRLIL